jgi:hypothetical protein
MSPKTKAQIKRQIKSGEVLVCHGHKVKIVEIIDKEKVRCRRMKRSRGSFGYLTVYYDQLEKIIPSPYSHKRPADFLKRKGFRPISSDAGQPLFEGKIDGRTVIIGYSNPPTVRHCDISIGVDSPSGGTAYLMSSCTDFNQALVQAQSLVKQLYSKKAKPKKRPKKK